MGIVTGMAAINTCPFGMVTSTLAVIPKALVLGTTGPIGSIMDTIPFANVVPFGMCMSLANPVTAALTALAFGFLTPGPCIPTIIGAWVPTSPTVLCGVMPILTMDSKATCAFGGCVSIVMPGQFTVMA